jgi:5-methylcytosine-specific restriction enzyme subunit McrC
MLSEYRRKELEKLFGEFVDTFVRSKDGQSHTVGDRQMIPFLVNMPRLYELFVAEWLRAHLPAAYIVKSQVRFNLEETQTLYFDIDLVVYDATDGRAILVLDTKYKTAEKPTTEEITQILAYAHVKRCREGVLVYPERPTRGSQILQGGIRIRCAPFALGGDLEEAGMAFLAELGLKETHGAISQVGAELP